MFMNTMSKVLVAAGCVVSTAQGSDTESIRDFPVSVSEIRVVDTDSTTTSLQQTPVQFEITGSFEHNHKPFNETFSWIVLYENVGSGSVGRYLFPTREGNTLWGCRSASSLDSGRCDIAIGSISLEGQFEPLPQHTVFVQKAVNKPPLWMRAFCLVTSICSPFNASWFQFGLKPTP